MVGTGPQRECFSTCRGGANVNIAHAHTEQPSLQGRRALVTGGTTGIGRAIAVLLATYGVKGFICGRNPDHLQDALTRIGEVGEGSGVAVDLAKQAARRRVFSGRRRFSRRDRYRSGQRRGSCGRLGWHR